MNMKKKRAFIPLLWRICSLGPAKMSCDYQSFDIFEKYVKVELSSRNLCIYLNASIWIWIPEFNPRRELTNLSYQRQDYKGRTNFENDIQRPTFSESFAVVGIVVNTVPQPRESSALLINSQSIFSFSLPSGYHHSPRKHTFYNEPIKIQQQRSHGSQWDFAAQ